MGTIRSHRVDDDQLTHSTLIEGSNNDDKIRRVESTRSKTMDDKEKMKKVSIKPSSS
jgi:uncharacterized membrane protein (DUF106 family)